MNSLNAIFNRNFISGFIHRSGQVARGQGHLHTVCQDGFGQVKDKARRYIKFRFEQRELKFNGAQIMSSLSPDVDAGNLFTPLATR